MKSASTGIHTELMIMGDLSAERQVACDKLKTAPAPRGALKMNK